MAAEVWPLPPWEIEAVAPELWMNRFLALNNARVYAAEVRDGIREPDGRKKVGTIDAARLASMPDV